MGEVVKTGRRRRIRPLEKESMAAGLRWRFARDCEAAGLRPGDLLPGVNELTARYGVTLAIARDLYRGLAKEGAVEAFHGKGVYLRRSLEGGGRPRSLSLGVVAHQNFSHPAHIHNIASHALYAFERKSSEFGGSSRLFNLFPEREITIATLEEIKASRPDGLLLLPSSEADTDDELRKLMVLGIPVVVAGNLTSLTHCIVHDQRQIASVAIEHLHSLGLEKLAFIQARGDQYWKKDRQDEFNSSGGGLVCLLNSTPGTKALKDEISEIFIKLQSKCVEGVLCSGDIYAVELLKKARAMKVRVPEDLAIVGIDDDWNSRPFNLTTVQQSFYDLGFAAYDLLSEVIINRHEKPLERRVRCPLLIRDTAPARINKF